MQSSIKFASRTSCLATLLPGFLVAATGVGAGDLATASFAGSHLGVAVLWAVAAGGILKFTLTEGLARWQLATGMTFLEGLATYLGPIVGWMFLPYLLLWSFFVGGALMSACGITLHALIPLFDEAAQAKIYFGILSSMVGLALILKGNFKLFETLMSICVGLMFFTVMLTAFSFWPNTSLILQGLFIPSIPNANGNGITWTIALMGGVGGTLTILCYGYWIRETGRQEIQSLGICRIDLAVSYCMTILFGMAMVIIGSTIKLDANGAHLLIVLADRLGYQLGDYARYLFLVGAFSAVFSSLLGVWQAVPYLFADIWRLFFKKQQTSTLALTQSTPYKCYLIAIATIPSLSLCIPFQEIQKIYGVVGAMFVPLLAFSLLMMNSQKQWLGIHTNKRLSQLILTLTLIFFASIAWFKL